MTVIILIVKSGLSCSARRAPQVVNQVSGGDNRSETRTPRPCDEPRWGPIELTFSGGDRLGRWIGPQVFIEGLVVVQDLAIAVPVDFRASSAGVLSRLRW
jgi:hypothetical protein